MQIISGTTQFRIPEGTAVAIGKFDGLHLGHRKLLDVILRQKEDGLKAAVFTFDPSPEVLFGMNPSRELSTNKEKRELFREIGIDILVEFPFNKDTAAISPEDFVIDILVNRMNAKFVAAGTDLSFGAKGKGNFAMLSSLAEFAISVSSIISRSREKFHHTKTSIGKFFELVIVFPTTCVHIFLTYYFWGSC